MSTPSVGVKEIQVGSRRVHLTAAQYDRLKSLVSRDTWFKENHSMPDFILFGRIAYVSEHPEQFPEAYRRGLWEAFDLLASFYGFDPVGATKSGIDFFGPKEL